MNWFNDNIKNCYVSWYPSVVQYFPDFKAQVPDHSSVFYAFNRSVVSRTQNAQLTFYPAILLYQYTHHDQIVRYMIWSTIRKCYFFAVEFFDKNVPQDSYQSLV